MRKIKENLSVITITGFITTTAIICNLFNIQSFI